MTHAVLQTPVILNSTVINGTDCQLRDPKVPMAMPVAYDHANVGGSACSHERRLLLVPCSPLGLWFPPQTTQL